MGLHKYEICDSDFCNSREPHACVRSQRLCRFCLERPSHFPLLPFRPAFRWLLRSQKDVRFLAAALRALDQAKNDASGKDFLAVVADYWNHRCASVLRPLSK